MRYVRFGELPEEFQEAMDKQSAKWFNMSKFHHAPDVLVETCKVCGCPACLSKCLDDKPAPCEGREVTIKCKCGRVYTYDA